MAPTAPPKASFSIYHILISIRLVARFVQMQWNKQ